MPSPGPPSAGSRPGAGAAHQAQAGLQPPGPDAQGGGGGRLQRPLGQAAAARGNRGGGDRRPATGPCCSPSSPMGRLCRPTCGGAPARRCPSSTAAATRGSGRRWGSAQDDAGDPQLFVLSLKTGGVGLNLTRATHVFHFDRWWNPAVADQATDPRTYRIGQTNRVMVQVHHQRLSGGEGIEPHDPREGPPGGRHRGQRRGVARGPRSRPAARPGGPGGVNQGSALPLPCWPAPPWPSMRPRPPGALSGQADHRRPGDRVAERSDHGVLPLPMA